MRKHFYLATSLLFWLLMVVGFSDDRLFDLGQESSSDPKLLLHAFFAFSWFSLLVAQASLIETGRAATHRRLGIAAITAFAGLVLARTYIYVAGTIAEVAPSPAGLLNIALFAFGAGLVVRGFSKRRADSELHKRNILIGTFLLLEPGMGRPLAHLLGAGPGLAWPLTYLALFGLFVWYYRKVVWQIAVGFLIWLAGTASVVASTGPAAVEAAATESTERIARLEERLPALLDQHGVAAISVAIVRDGELSWSATYGRQGPNTPATSKTLFNVASMAKPIAAETVLRLAAAGRLSLDSSMAPAWVDPDLAGDVRHRLLTPRIALSHRTGFPNWRRENAGGRLAFLADPGARFGYSGEGYNYVARYAEARTGEGFERLADELVFGPMGLEEISFSSRGWMAGRVATPMDSIGGWGEPDLRPEGDWKAADDVFTTATEYARFMIGVMRGEGLDSALADERFRPQVSIADQWPCVVEPASACPTGTSMALGWLRFDYGEHPLIWHGGDDWGEHSLAYFYPETGDGFVILVNGGNGRYAVIDAADLLDDRSPVPHFAAIGRSPLGTWLRALLDAAYAGKISGRPADDSTEN